MNDFYGLAATRRSTRSFADQPIPPETLADLVRAATTAPSGCNSQCWRFVALRGRPAIDALAATVRSGCLDFFLGREDSDQARALGERMAKTATLFVRAPAAVAVFMTRLDYYNAAVTDFAAGHGLDYRAMMDALSWPDVLSIGAAVQNLLLAAWERGIGSVWMNEPAVAGDAIRRLYGLDEGHRFVSLVALGYPAKTPGPKAYKPFEEVYSLVE
jgi:nitroreductase